MERNQKLHNAIGIAMKAGKLQSGDQAVEKLVRARRACLVLMDADVSFNTREKYEWLCRNSQTQLLAVPELGTAIGKPGRMLAAVTDNQLTNLVRKAAEAEDSDKGTRG